MIKRIYIMPSTCKKGFKAIQTGITIKDKFIILISLLFASIFRFIYRLLKRDPPAYGEFIVKDIVVRNEDGIFYCRKRSHDYSITLPAWEKEVRSYFDLTGGVFVDVGAHIGKYTIMMARRLGSHGKVIAFEPDHGNYRSLLINLSLNNCKNVIPLNIGLWKQKGKLKLYDLNDKNTGMKSMVSSKDNSKYSIVEVDTLDNVLKKLGIETVDLIKIDVEGAEVEVLEGAKEALKQKPKIIFESWNEEKCKKIQHMLKSYGYKIEKTAVDGLYFGYV